VASSLAFISQSLAAAIAGVQQPAPAQATSSAVSDSDTDSDTTEAVSMGSSSSATVQTLVTTLANDTAAGLKAASDANSASSGSKSDTSASTASPADGSSAAVSAFQAQMSISSHFQQPPTQDSSPNRIDAPVGSPAFNDELGGKITWLANQGIQSASVQLSPEHLGPVSVHISVQAGSASVSFNAAHADTRAALEQALPRLREMFATNGLTLADANVSHQSPRGQAQKQSISPIGASRGGASEETTSSTTTSVAVSRLGLVDTYV
jgi:flagellar hook-length control protein FliK